MSDEEFARRAERFPLHPPTTKEYYLLRSIFEEHFVTGFENGDCAYATCPFGKSIACSTPEAVSWDPEWEKSVGDISGRAVKNVHVAADEFEVKKDAVNEGVTASMVGGVRERGVRVKARASRGVQRRGTSYARFAGLRAAPSCKVLCL